jgi:hypothetical protein
MTLLCFWLKTLSSVLHHTTMACRSLEFNCAYVNSNDFSVANYTTYYILNNSPKLIKKYESLMIGALFPNFKDSFIVSSPFSTVPKPHLEDPGELELTYMYICVFVYDAPFLRM